jgi:hypothetical protein
MKNSGTYYILYVAMSSKVVFFHNLHRYTLLQRSIRKINGTEMYKRDQFTILHCFLLHHTVTGHKTAIPQVELELLRL